MKKKLFGYAVLLLSLCMNAQNVRYATITSDEYFRDTGACYGSNGAYFNLLSANPQLLASLNPDDYDLTDYVSQDVFGPRNYISPYLLDYHFSCPTTVNLRITNKYNPEIYFEGKIILKITKPTVEIHHYSQANGAGDYFYTKNYSTLGDGSAYGYNYQGVAFKAHNYQANRSIPVYRYFNAQFGDHFYTVTPFGSNSYGYVLEGIEFYAYNYRYPGTVPVYRYYSPSLQNHFYSIYSYGTNQGYVYEGIEFYAFPPGNQLTTGKESEVSQKDSSINETGNTTIYPNPTSGIVTINNDSNIIDSVTVNDILGKTVQTKTVNNKQVELDLSNMSNGIYLVKVKSQGVEKVMKVLKE
ncbi:T9SS type A sorting domain-containing protein [Flavobacterium sp.]|uniref:T9SS type A sorting domain-containing protein n=1 Tax=Flavobacterium sp. TaxID=239 RepID=UPI00286B5A67|nr:T9SS type A sorting domain-containing protein [Flavobacterium sp.]